MFRSARPIPSPPHWPRRVEVFDPPHLHSRASSHRTYLAFCVAAAPAIAGGVVIFGYSVAGVYAFAALGALAGEGVCRALLDRHSKGQFAHALAMALLLAMTLPPTVAWPVPFFGGLAGIVVGKWILGGIGSYVWHPALVGWALVAILSPGALAPARWPVLAQGHLFDGSLYAASSGAGYRGYGWSQPPPGVEAWSLPRPIDVLASRYAGPAEPGGHGASLLAVFRDHLPPWADTLWGVVGGGVGATFALAIIAGGLLLVYWRCARWQLPVGALATVAILAAIWPIRGGGQTNEWLWFPIRATQDGSWLGAGIILFHLTGGGLLLACWLIAPDPVSSPLTARGHLLFGIGIGAVAFGLRVTGWAFDGAYWAVLIMNTLVPLIDRVTRRRVYGT